MTSGTEAGHDRRYLPPNEAEYGLGVVDAFAISSHRNRSRWLLAFGALVVVATVGWTLGQRVQSSDQAASRAAPPEPSWITAVVEQRVLSQTVISRGTVRPEVSVEVHAPSSIEGETIITSIGVGVGDEAAEGTRLVEVSGRPVFLMSGAVPVYRTLKPGMSGADVAQLQQALTRLGYSPEMDGTFGQATKDAVAAFYDVAGYAAQPTSDTVDADLAAAEQALIEAQAVLDDAEEALTTLNRVGQSPELVAAQNELDAARRAVEDTIASSNAAIALNEQQVDIAVSASDQINSDPAAAQTDRDQAEMAVSQANAALDQARRDATSQTAAANDRVELARAGLAAVQEAADTKVATRNRDNALAARDSAAVAVWSLMTTTGPTVPQGEIVFVPTLPTRVQTAVPTLGPIGQPAGQAGDTSTPSSALITLSGGSLVVSTTARPAEADLVRVGMPVEILDERTNTTYPATISDLDLSPTAGGEGQVGYPITLTPDSVLPPELVAVNVRVTFTAASTETESLVVPIAAVSAAADGSARVSVLRNDASEPTDVAVIAGLSADGFVAIVPSGAGSLKVGDRVVVGR
jgi:peptidoglycan hydrolase-like protein with peptidoglycan-binding domain